MKNKQGITIAALIIAIIGLSVGFAAFSNTLQISSSASVNPDTNSLKVIFAKDYFTEQKTTLNQLDTTAVVPTTVGTGITATDGVINNDGQNGPTLTGLSAAFTEPGQSATYNLYVVNAGQLKAYLTDVVFGTTGSPAKKVSCTVAQTKRVNNADVALTDEEKATESLIDAACEGISVKVGSLSAMTSSGSLNNLELNAKGYAAVQIVISYASGSAYVDGPMNVAFGDITINASSVAVVNQQQTGNTEILTINQIKSLEFDDGIYMGNASTFWSSDTIQKLINNSSIISDNYYFNDIECSDNSLSSITFDEVAASPGGLDDCYLITYTIDGDDISFIIMIKKDGIYLGDNSEDDVIFDGITFTITGSDS